MSEFTSSALASLAKNNQKLLEEAQQKAAEIAAVRLNANVGAGFPALREALESIASGQVSIRGAKAGGGLESLARPDERRGRAALEAIVLRIVRPPLLIRGGSFVDPDPAHTVQEVIDTVARIDREKARRIISSVGRVNLSNVPSIPFVGTGWIIQKRGETTATIVTNRHVANEFAEADGRGIYALKLLPNYREYGVKLDFLEEYGNSATLEAPLVKILYVAGPRSPDVALLEIQDEALRGLEPVEMATERLAAGDDVAVVGYPAYDSRNDAGDMAAYFGDIYNVKRYAFGKVMTLEADGLEFSHDCTTLGGNSGSVVYHRGTGKAVGLHFAGDANTANYAVPIDQIKAAMAGLSSTSVVASRALTEAAGDGLSAASGFKGRDGYNTAFLDEAVARPGFGAWENDVAAVSEEGGGGNELKYRHFSVWMCKSRKLPLITAVNIDGGKSKRLGRIDTWYVDGRLGAEYQVDNAAYVKNPLDRGHMVRREDPVWGSLEQARQANKDTFHYTNAAPQHEGLNQKDWVNLEDYVLGNAKTLGLKVSVFTGPVFKDDDPLYRNLVKLPRSFWKIVAIINEATGKLSVTGYVLGQGDLIKGMIGEFVYGPFRSYQVEVGEIGHLTGLSVADLARHDPLARRRKSEGVSGTDKGRFVVISGADDLVL